MADRVLHASMDFRSLNEEKRQATFVCSTENPVRTYGDPEVLRMAGCQLGRYRKNPVLLDAHQRYSLESVLGSCDVQVKGRELMATPTYARNKAGENAWQLVKDGHVRAMSIGYVVNPAKVTRLREGQFDGEGDSRVEGPATVANEWTLLEISNVPVPADENAVRREFYDSISQEAPVANENVPAGSLIARAMHTDTPPVAPQAPVAASAPQAPAPQPTRSDVTPSEYARREILGFTPPGLEAVAHDCILRGLPVEGARAEILKAHAARHKPIGTPEVHEPQTKPDATRALEGVSDDLLLRSLESI